MRDSLDELRHIEGFPIGEDEDLHALSDPPYYTAYPNPHIAEFIKQYGKPYDEATDQYHCEPYVSDVSEGKNDPIYNAHSYHTKVPYKAIMPFIDHYTESGDIVFDGFCGTGMTGVAAQVLGRHAVLCDLSPAATFIAYNYTTPVDAAAFEREAKRILDEIQTECGWMYETKYKDGRKGRINFTVWSDVFLCTYCKKEFVFWDVAFDSESGRIRDTFNCPHCQADLTKSELHHAVRPVYDTAISQTIERAIQYPVLINYSANGKRHSKKPDADDLNLVRSIEAQNIPYWYPSTRIDRDIDIWYERDYRSLGIYSVNAFYTKRNLWMTACLYNKIRQVTNLRLRSHLLFWAQSVAMGFSRLNRYREQGYSQVNQLLSGTLYVGSTTAEISPWYALEGKITRMAQVGAMQRKANNLITTCSASARILPANSVDYIFTDPPFGSNIIYSDLSIVWESWLHAFTNTDYETVVHRRKHNGFSLDTYRGMMAHAFEAMYTALKPGRWITVVFHNSKASVWNAIQESLAHAGFLVAQVTVMDKQQGSFKQVTSAGAVKNDLVINAYKPLSGFTNRFISRAGYGLEAEFVRQHLEQLPVAANVERSKEMLYSKYLAYYVQHGYHVAYNSQQYYRALQQWGLVERDGFWFTDSQAHEYEQAKARRGKLKTGGVPTDQSVLFISDERSARQWLWGFLDEPKSYDDIYTAFVRALQTPEDEIPELKTMLEEGFVRTNGHWKRPDSLTQAELDKRRHERLLHQFEEYVTLARKGQRLKEVRKEALVEGFAEAYRQNRFQDILAVGRKLDKRLLEENQDIYDFIDIAEAKVEG